MRIAGVQYTASGAILNPWYIYAVVYTSNQTNPFGKREAPEIASPQRIELADRGLRILFGPDAMIFCALDRDIGLPVCVEPLRWFVLYRTLINYNMEVPVLELPDLDTYQLTEEVRILRNRLRMIEHGETVGGMKRITYSYTEDAETLKVSVTELLTYLRILDDPLSYALVYYLRCEDPRYFLIEYYKATESVFEGLGGEKKALRALAPHGVSAKEYKRFARYCNEQMHGILDGGRHGPKPGATMETIDRKMFWSSPKALEVFECASRVCRSVIDGYMALRAAG
jgi:hypothetical protein